MPYYLLEKHGIQQIVMPAYIDGAEYEYDPKNKPDFADFTAALRAKKTPTTSAMHEEGYTGYFEPHLKAGKDILYVSYSTTLTSSFENMRKVVSTLESKYPNRKIYHVDTTKVSAGVAILVLQVASALKQGMSPEEIIKMVEKEREHKTVMFVVEDLGHLKRGGRISGATALIGKLLNVKPILHMEGGKLEKCGKASGMRKAIMHLYDVFEKDFEPAPDAPVFILGTDTPQHTDLLFDLVNKHVAGRSEVIKHFVSSSISAHCGPGTIGITYNRKKK